MVYFTALAVCMGAMSGGVTAQTRYTCNSNGNIYQSTQPCPVSGLVYHGPVSNPRYEPPVPKIAQAPASLSYLSARCASLNDAIRTAPARGLKYDTINELRSEYSRECADNEREASNRVSQDRNAQKQRMDDAKNADREERERASIREQQCGESKRILYTKRARTDLTDGERADLRRFEETYRSRCG